MCPRLRWVHRRPGSTIVDYQAHWSAGSERPAGAAARRGERLQRAADVPGCWCGARSRPYDPKSTHHATWPGRRSKEDRHLDRRPQPCLSTRCSMEGEKYGSSSIKSCERPASSPSPNSGKSEGTLSSSICSLFFLCNVPLGKWPSNGVTVVFISYLFLLFAICFCCCFVMNRFVRSEVEGGREHGLVFVLPSFSKRLPLRYMCMHMAGGGKNLLFLLP